MLSAGKEQMSSSCNDKQYSTNTAYIPILSHVFKKATCVLIMFTFTEAEPCSIHKTKVHLMLVYENKQ